MEESASRDGENGRVAPNRSLLDSVISGAYLEMLFAIGIHWEIEAT